MSNESHMTHDIQNSLVNTFCLEHCEVLDESYMHHSGKDAGTHFKLVIVSKDFIGKPLIQRHRQLQKLFASYIAQNIRMSFHCYTPEEFATTAVPDTPHCRGGYHK